MQEVVPKAAANAVRTDTIRFTIQRQVSFFV